MKEIVFFLEEPSMKEMLGSFLPRLSSSLPKITYIVFEGKSDLKKRIQRKMQHYNNPDAFFIILIDQDSANCKDLKEEIIQKIKDLHKPFLVRIVCHELESWYLADLQAVEKALFIKGLAQKQGQSRYRQPDSLSNAKQEFKNILGPKQAYQPLKHGREIGKYLDPDNQRSKSFAVFVESYRKLL